MDGPAQQESNGPRLRFQIEWLSGFVNVPFSSVEHIKQRVNSNFSVTASQDGQEIGGRAGKQLSSMLVTAGSPFLFFSFLSFSFLSFSSLLSFLFLISFMIKCRKKIVEEGRRKSKSRPNPESGSRAKGW